MSIEITFKENGCVVVEGASEIRLTRDGTTETLDATTVALCRCGQSGNKPFCDGTHKRVGFAADPVRLELV